MAKRVDPSDPPAAVELAGSLLALIAEVENRRQMAQLSLTEVEQRLRSACANVLRAWLERTGNSIDAGVCDVEVGEEGAEE
jgi:hypothetical protein